MHISLDSALGKQRRLNQVGETISSIAAPTAAYSLRSLTGGDPKVVRVRRESDNDEQDFTASEVASGAMLSYVNAPVTAPLDIKALTSGGTDDGRNGDFLIAKAAYSLRSLGTRQATVTSSGDTAGDTSGKYVCQVRSITGDIKSFTATEVSDGTLVDFVLGNTKSLLNSRAYLDGSNDNVGLTSEIDLTGDFSLEYSFVVTEASQQIIGKNASGSYLRAEGSTEITGFRIQTNGSASTVSLTSNLKYGEANTVKLKRVSGKFGIYNESDTLISAEFTNSDTFTISSFGKAGGSFAKGVIYNIRIDTNNDGTINHSYNGYGNTLSDWQDLVGSNNAAAVNGSPALFTGQDQDGFVKTWYDQSVSDQAGSATGNHATQTTADNQPKIVSAGSLVSGGLEFDGSNDFFALTSSITQSGAFSYFFALDGLIDAPKTLVGTSGGASPRVRCESSNLEIKSSATEINYSTSVWTANSGKSLVSFNRNGSNSASAHRDGVEIGTAGSMSGNLTHDRLFKLDDANSANFTGKCQEVIIYDTDQTDNRTAIEANIGEVYNIDLPSGVDPLNNEVNGFVETWYDQFGSKDAAQPTVAKQPKIVDAGSLITGGGIFFDGSNDQLDFTALNAGDLAIFSVLKFDDVSGQRRILGEDSTNSEGFGIGNATNGFFRGNGGSSLAPALNATISTSGDFLYSLTRASDSITFFTKGVASGANTRSEAFKANSIGGSTNPIAGNLKEIIIYSSDQTSKRTTLEANIAAEYGITLS